MCILDHFTGGGATNTGEKCSRREEWKNIYAFQMCISHRIAYVILINTPHVRGGCHGEGYRVRVETKG